MNGSGTGIGQVCVIDKVLSSSRGYGLKIEGPGTISSMFLPSNESAQAL